MNFIGNPTEHAAGGEVVALGVFGPKFSLQNLPGLVKELEGLKGKTDASLRQSLAFYLRNGTTVIPFMEFTTDVLNNSFGVAGGSAILTDGLYFWRRDAAEYVATYGIGLPNEFIEHARKQGWRPSAVSADELLRIHDLVETILSRPALP